jgi:mono/diheme cytochrome c family protein
MESPSFVQTLKNKNWRFETATSLEDVLCLAVLETHNEAFKVKDVFEARKQWLELFQGDCANCPYHVHCMASMMNE